MERYKNNNILFKVKVKVNKIFIKSKIFKLIQSQSQSQSIFKYNDVNQLSIIAKYFITEIRMQCKICYEIFDTCKRPVIFCRGKYS